MASQVPGNQLRTLLHGTKVERAAAAVAAGTKQSIFTVSGGRVIITALVGTVTTTIGSTAATLSYGTTPSSGTAQAAGISTATAITSAEVGTLITPAAATIGATVVGTSAKAGGAALTTVGIVVNAGTIDYTTSADPVGGALKFTLFYVPLDDGASVTAA